MEIVIYQFCHTIGVSDPKAIEIATGVVCGGIALSIMATVFIRIMDMAEGVLDRMTSK